MSMKVSIALLSAMMAASVLLMAGCESSDSSSSSSDSQTEGALPKNPTLDDQAGDTKQMWSFGYKDYDHTFRLRWPTYFATDLGVGPGSYNTVNGERAEFRGFDYDDGAQRASYTLPGPSYRLCDTSTELTCVLYSADGQALAWFKTYVPAEGEGMLSAPLP